MYIVEVIPLVTLPPNVPQILSYYFDSPLMKGQIAEIPLHSRKVNSVVISSTPISEQKAVLKNSDFQLKKITRAVTDLSVICERQFKIALWLSKNYFAPLGMSLKSILPPFFLKKKYPFYWIPRTVETSNSIKPLVIISRAASTLEHIDSLIWNIKGANSQVLIVVPEQEQINYFKSYFINKYDVVTIHSGMSNAELFAAWQKAVIDPERKIIFIGTRQSLFLPFQNLSLLIVDDPHHEFYKSDMTPKYNTPDLAKYIAEIYDAKLAYTTPFKSTVDYYKEREDLIELKDETSLNPGRLEIVDLISEIKSKQYTFISQTMKEHIVEAVRNKNKILIFSSRRGYSGLYLCGNCGTATKCPNCDIPLRVHKSVDFILLCHHCGYQNTLTKSCSNCNSYKLNITGPYGSQKIYDDLYRLRDFNQLPKVPILILDSDVVKTPAEESEIMESLNNKNGASLIATHMIFSHRYWQKFNLVCIPAFDALMPKPDYNAQENLWYTMEKILDFQPKEIVIQTFDPSQPFFISLSPGKKELYEKELKYRKLLGFPPYSRIVTLTFSHLSQRKAEEAGQQLTSKLKMAIVRDRLEKQVKVTDSAPAFISKERGRYSFVIVLKLRPEFSSIRDLLKYVPNQWLVNVDPRSII